MQEETWDAVIAGCGLAGLSLAHALSLHRKDSFRILLLDTEKRRGRDHTWCFWEPGEGDWECCISWEWKQVQVGLSGNLHKYDLEKYRYKILESDRFYEFVWNELEQDSRFEFRHARIAEIRDGALGMAEVETDDGSVFSAHQIFTSIPEEETSIRTWQHFLGWEVKTQKAAFNPDVATLMDFKPDEDGEVRFLYVLPKSEQEALVEFTVFGPGVWQEERYTRFLIDYLRSELEVGSWVVKYEEKGAIPMSGDLGKSLNHGSRIQRIGTAGGAVKASTGYAFSRIQRESRWIAEHWELGKACPKPKPSWLYRSCDATLLELIRVGEFPVSTYFDGLFRRWGGDRVLDFLDEGASPSEVLEIMVYSPWKVFIPAWIRANWMRKKDG